jgi:hypothetical protein
MFRQLTFNLLFPFEGLIIMPLANPTQYKPDSSLTPRPYSIGHFPKKGILFMRRRSTRVVVLPNTNDSAIDAWMK